MTGSKAASHAIFDGLGVNSTTYVAALSDSIP